MEIFVPLVAEGFEFCHPDRKEDFEFYNEALNGTRRGFDWHPPSVHLVREDNGKVLAESDCPWLGSHALVFRPRAVVALRPLLEACGELLPMSCDAVDLVVFNTSVVPDALDEANSSVIRFSDSRIMRILRYAFRRDCVGRNDAFKISNLRVSPTFVTGQFVETWKAAGLRGLVFQRVWSSNAPAT